MSATYRPGRRPAVVGSRAAAVLDASADHALVAALWELAEHGGGFDDVVAALMSAPLTDVASFAVAAARGERLHVLVRGHGIAEVSGPAACRVAADGLATWREESFDADCRLTLHVDAGASTAASFPAGLGVVLVESVDFCLMASEPIATATPGAAAAPGLTDTQVFVPLQDSPAVPAPSPAPAAPSPFADGASSQEAGSRRGRYEHMFRGRHAQPPSGLGSPEIAEPSGAPVDTAQPEPEPVAPPEPTSVASAPSAPAPAAVPTPTAGALIDGVPWLSTPASPVAPEAPTAPQDSPEDEREATTKRGAHQRLLAELAAGADRVGPLVHAVSCGRGHLNDPQRDRCRLCGEPLSDQTPVTVPRPVLGELHLSTGDVVVLDRGVLLGRNPRTEADQAERPHLVKVGAGKSDVSRSHVSVVLDGWHVLVQDLRSTNGTEVTLPGQQPQRLREGEPLPIEPGTLVTLADGVSFRYEVTA